MDINALPIQTSPAAESSNSATSSVSADSTGTPSFAQQFQQANQKTSTREAASSTRTSDEAKPQTNSGETTVATGNENSAAATTTTENIVLPGSPLLALMGMQLRLSGQAAPQPQDTVKKITTDEPKTTELDTTTAGLLATASISPQLLVNTAQNAGLPSGTTLTPTPQLANNTERPTPVLNASQARNDAPSYQTLNSMNKLASSGQTENSAFNQLLQAAPDSRVLTPATKLVEQTTNTLSTEPAPTNRIDANLVALQTAAANANAPTTSTLNTSSTPLIASTIGSTEWQQDLGQQVIQLHQRGDQQVELRLHPAELGPMSITLKVGEHGAQVQFVSAHAHVRNAIEQAIPQLREALAEQGINLGQTSVGSQQQQPRDQQQAASQQSREQVDFSLDDKGVTTVTGQTLQIPTPGQLSLYA